MLNICCWLMWRKFGGLLERLYRCRKIPSNPGPLHHRYNDDRRHCLRSCAAWKINNMIAQMGILSFFSYPLKRPYDRDAFADIISADQVHFVIRNPATSAARTTSTSDVREIRRTSRAVRITLFDRTDGSQRGPFQNSQRTLEV